MLKFKKTITSIFVITFIVLIIIFPDVSKQAVSHGIMMSASVIIPSLFPFTVCILIILKSIITTNCFLEKITYFLFGHNIKMFFVFVLSLIGGYPTGAKLINELYEQKEINKNTANIMLTYCVNAGPAFIVSIVSLNFGYKIIGYILFFTHIASSILIALLCSKSLKKEKIIIINNKINNNTFFENLILSVADASRAMLQICGFIIVFTVINAYLDLFLNNMPIIRYVSYFTEITTAISKTNNVYFISFLLGFSGLCIWCQIFAITNNIKINLFKFIISRILHGSISVILTKIAFYFFKIKISTFSNEIYIKSSFIYSNISVTISLVVLMIVFLIFIYTKNSCGKILKDVI